MITKELQDHVWKHCLPKEFKEEVKKEYKHQIWIDNEQAYWMLERIFGKHNLTSDAEGEEMLTVSRKKVQEIYRDADNLRKDSAILHHAIYWNAEVELLQDLFGSKCLPDEVAVAENATTGNVDSPEPNVDSLEPKPAEPKFKVGDEAFYVCSPTLKHKCTVTKVMQNEHNGKREYNVMFEWGKPGMWILESDLEPYTEPKYEHQHDDTAQKSADVNSNRNLPQETADCDNLSNNVLTDTQNAEIGNFVVKNEMVDHIIKDGFSKERRLNIAAQMLQALVCAPIISGVDPNPPAEQLAQTAFRLADALIAEAEKGGRDGEG